MIERNDTPPHRHEAIRSLASFQGLIVREDEGLAVDGLTFDVMAGEVCALVGPEGSGKTTALRALLGDVDANPGMVSLLGARPNAPEFARVRDRIGLSLDPGALIDRPPLVVLDEPTVGLDRRAATAAREVIRALPQRGSAVLLATSDWEVAQAVADRAVILQWGRPTAQGLVTELLSRADLQLQVVVDPGRVEKAIAALRDVGLTAAHDGDRSITVVGEIDSPEAVRGSLYAAGIHVWELRPGRDRGVTVPKAAPRSGQDGLRPGV